MFEVKLYEAAWPSTKKIGEKNFAVSFGTSLIHVL